MIFAYEVNKKIIQSKKFSIYGIDYNGLENFFYCLQLNIPIMQFVVENKDVSTVFFRKVISIEDYYESRPEEDILIISQTVKNDLVKNDKRSIRLEDILIVHLVTEKEVFIDNENYRNLEMNNEIDQKVIVMDTLKWRKKLILSDGKMITKSSIFDMIKSQYEGKKFQIIGTKKQIDIMKNFFKLLNIECEYFNIHDNFECLKTYQNQNEVLFYDNISPTICEKLNEKGYKNKNSIKNFLTYTMEEVYERNIVMDVSLGYNFNYDNSRYIGFKEYGDYHNAKYKIIALGNSTTDGGENDIDESWPYYLFEELNRIYPNQVAILNGGGSGYNISQELIKFIRDVSQLSPSLVLSYSGCINMAQNTKNTTEFVSNWQKLLYKMTTVVENQSLEFGKIDKDNRCFGVPYTGNKYEYFINQAKMLHAVANTIGISYYCFLQPTIYTKNTLCLEEKEKLVYYHSAHLCHQSKEFVEAYKSDKNEYDWLIDFSGIFDEVENVYKDIYHVYGFANKIIAKEMEKCIFKTNTLDIERMID
jgi:hypothetical protein